MEPHPNTATFIDMLQFSLIIVSPPVPTVVTRSDRRKQEAPQIGSALPSRMPQSC